MVSKFSRSGRTSPFGKRGIEQSFSIDAESKEEFSKNAAALKIPLSEYIYLCLLVHHGKRAALEESYKDLLDSIEGTRGESPALKRVA